jgi:hypothetical protein
MHLETLSRKPSLRSCFHVIELLKLGPHAQPPPEHTGDEYLSLFSFDSASDAAILPSLLTNSKGICKHLRK